MSLESVANLVESVVNVLGLVLTAVVSISIRKGVRTFADQLLFLQSISSLMYSLTAAAVKTYLWTTMANDMWTSTSSDMRQCTAPVPCTIMNYISNYNSHIHQYCTALIVYTRHICLFDPLWGAKLGFHPFAVQRSYLLDIGYYSAVIISALCPLAAIPFYMKACFGIHDLSTYLFYIPVPVVLVDMFVLGQCFLQNFQILQKQSEVSTCISMNEESLRAKKRTNLITFASSFTISLTLGLNFFVSVASNIVVRLITVHASDDVQERTREFVRFRCIHIIVLQLIYTVVFPILLWLGSAEGKKRLVPPLPLQFHNILPSTCSSRRESEALVETRKGPHATATADRKMVVDRLHGLVDVDSEFLTYAEDEQGISVHFGYLETYI